MQCAVVKTTNMADDSTETSSQQSNESIPCTPCKSQAINPSTEENEQDCEETLDSWLKANSLELFYTKMAESGVTAISHLQDVSEGDAMSEFGMSKFQAKRLSRVFTEWKERKEQGKRGTRQQHFGVSSLVTNNKAVVVELPLAFQGFFGTRDGGKSVVVSTSTLTKKWKSLYYSNPLNPFQRASNSFILKMCEANYHRFTNQRLCESWARAERDKRVTLLLALEKNTNGWTLYYKKKSIYGTLSVLDEKFPFVKALTDKSLKRADYESCVEVKEALESLSSTNEKHQATVFDVIADACESSGKVKSGKSERYEFYKPLKNAFQEVQTVLDARLQHAESLVTQCFSKYGASGQDKLKKRKTEKNKKKEKSKQPFRDQEEEEEEEVEEVID